jgi:hypothetical protein
MVWSTNAEEAKRLVKLPEDQFVDAINDALVGRQQRENRLFKQFLVEGLPQKWTRQSSDANI